LIGSTTFNRQCYYRDPRLSAHSGLDHYLLQVFTAGRLRGDFSGTNVRADTGDICITDLSQTLKSDVQSGSTLSVTLPRQLLDAAMASRNLHGTVLHRRMPMTGLLVGYLQGLCSLQTPLPHAQAAAVEEATVSLLSAALKSVQPAVVADVVVSSTNLRERVLEFIAHNVYLPELSPDFLCHRFHVSRAHLYRAFAHDGGVAKMLRDVRLDAAYRELTQTVSATHSITEIAYGLGFSSSNQLLRSFRARFGVTPSEARASEAKAEERRAADHDRQNMDLHSHFARFSSKARS
jgi:AraC-like DNA-binding protein